MNPQLVRIATSRAQQYVARIPAAISGQGGHDQTFSVAVALLHGFALPEREAWPILTEYGARCQPPWSVDDLRHKFEDAGRVSRHSKPRGHLLTNGRGSLVIVRRPESRPAPARVPIGRVYIPENLPVITPRAIPVVDPLPVPTPVRILDTATYRKPPAEWCPICWASRARALRPGSCICTGDVFYGNRCRGNSSNDEAEKFLTKPNILSESKGILTAAHAGACARARVRDAESFVGFPPTSHAHAKPFARKC